VLTVAGLLFLKQVKNYSKVGFCSSTRRPMAAISLWPFPSSTRRTLTGILMSINLKVASAHTT